jgi:phage-related protein
MPEKPLIWLGSSRQDVRAFPVDARRVAGFQLWRIQLGLPPNDWKPMTSVGPGVQEIRVRTGREHRVFCIARLAEAVYVLHAFEKRSRKTPRQDLEIARNRFRLLVMARGEQGG